MTKPADNPIRGLAVTEIDGRRVSLVFNWDALAKLRATFGDETLDLLNPDTLARVGELALAAHAPDLTADRLRELSPPLMPFVEAVNRAHHYALWGGGPEDASKKKKTMPSTPILWRRLSSWLFAWGSTRKSSGD